MLDTLCLNLASYANGDLRRAATNMQMEKLTYIVIQLLYLRSIWILKCDWPWADVFHVAINLYIRNEASIPMRPGHNIR
jgi:hypothetical protein